MKGVPVVEGVLVQRLAFRAPRYLGILLLSLYEIGMMTSN